jgi:tRNA threonylcarbamoyladenosine biosynthesis protein TsaB
MDHQTASHHESPAPRVLVIETSHRLGVVALALGDHILGERKLDEARRHARDLVPAIRELLAEHRWRARELNAVIVSRGPGSYTGLRVGVMTAKTLAYASGCALLAVDTFAAIALQAPADAVTLDVIADAQQDRLYTQRFTRTEVGEALAPASALTIQAFDVWSAHLPEGTWVSGPGLERCATRLRSCRYIAPSATWYPHADSLLRVGLVRFRHGERDDPYAVEPLYLRPSSAEEKWHTPGT